MHSREGTAWSEAERSAHRAARYPVRHGKHTMRIDWIESSTVDTYKRRNQHLLSTRARARAQAQSKCGIYA